MSDAKSRSDILTSNTDVTGLSIRAKPYAFFCESPKRIVLRRQINRYFSKIGSPYLPFFCLFFVKKMIFSIEILSFFIKILAFSIEIFVFSIEILSFSIEIMSFFIKIFSFFIKIMSFFIEILAFSIEILSFFIEKMAFFSVLAQFSSVKFPPTVLLNPFCIMLSW